MSLETADPHLCLIKSSRHCAFAPHLSSLQNQDDLPEDDTTLPIAPRDPEIALLAEREAAEHAHDQMHTGATQFGFYEWVEFLVRASWHTNNGKRDGVAWAFDRMLWTTVPDDVAIAMLPRECYGRARREKAKQTTLRPSLPRKLGQPFSQPPCTS